ncbi:MAG: dTDP-4-dehydrorhamnose 3,5-epimerase [Candidatus Hydrogenedentes bacterium]|nr:dTDP-4-dehydrorhamnose 3,5-epimerase [Candidatus Hydrogenedentota bacterium]
MIFTATALPNAFIIDPERIEDDRGFFARSYCEREFAAQGLRPHWVQCNISYNRCKGTLRGMHFQAAPHGEDKLIRCTRGAIHDVIIDLRAGSPTFKQHVAVDLTEENRRMLFVPRGFAHGFLTLTDHAEVFYQMSAFYEPGAGRGCRYDDPVFGIVWPAPVAVISERDRNYPDFGG